MFDGKKVTISNDGATIMKQLDIAHPAAKTLVDISMSQDAEVGDGTTSVVLLAAEMLKQVKIFVEDEVHPQILIRGVRLAAQLAVARIKEIAIKVDPGTPEARQMLEVFASTALNSKLISNHKKLFSPMVVDAVCCLDTNLLDLSLIGVKKVQGGSVSDSFLVEGVAFKKTFSYAGFEQMTKTFTDPKVLLLNVELELKSEKENAEVRITDVSDYQKIVDAEWKIIYDKLDKCVACGAQIILSKLPIGDLATQYFADRKLFCAGRVTPDELGSCGAFEEERVGEEKYNVFRGCPKAKSATIVLRGGIETELSRYLREHARGVEGKPQLVIRGRQGARDHPAPARRERGLRLDRRAQQAAPEARGRRRGPRRQVVRRELRRGGHHEHARGERVGARDQQGELAHGRGRGRVRHPLDRRDGAQPAQRAGGRGRRERRLTRAAATKNVGRHGRPGDAVAHRPRRPHGPRPRPGRAAAQVSPRESLQVRWAGAWWRRCRRRVRRAARR